MLALQEGDADSLDRTAGAIRGRAARVANVVTAEMSNYEPGIYTERVLEAVKVLRDQGNLFAITTVMICCSNIHRILLQAVILFSSK